MVIFVPTCFARVTGMITKATTVYCCLLAPGVATVPDFLCSKIREELDVTQMHI